MYEAEVEVEISKSAKTLVIMTCTKPMNGTWVGFPIGLKALQADQGNRKRVSCVVA